LITGSLDVMENLGKRTFDVLTEPVASDQQSNENLVAQPRKIRFHQEKPVLSSLLREAANRYDLNADDLQRNRSPIDNRNKLTFDVSFEKENGDFSVFVKFVDVSTLNIGYVLMDALKICSTGQSEMIESIFNGLLVQKRSKLQQEIRKIDREFLDIVNSDQFSGKFMCTLKHIQTNFSIDDDISETWKRLNIDFYDCTRITVFLNEKFTSVKKLS